MGDDGGGGGLILLLLLVALTAHFLGYPKIATVAFGLALAILAIVLIIFIGVIIAALWFSAY